MTFFLTITEAEPFTILFVTIGMLLEFFLVEYMRWLPKDDPHKLVVVHKTPQMDFPQNALPCH